MVTPVGSGLILRQEDANFLEFSMVAESCPCRAGRLSKTSPEVHIGFRGECGSPESRHQLLLLLGP